MRRMMWRNAACLSLCLTFIVAGNCFTAREAGAQYNPPPCGAVTTGPLRGAARGAAGGALIGAISGNAGRGAAIGATVGGVAGAARHATGRANGACY